MSGCAAAARSRWAGLPALGVFAVVVFAVIAPRLAALGDFIHMDEGYHAFMARYIYDSYHAGRGFPADMTGYKLYPWLFHWVWGLPGNSVVWLRLADLCVSACAAWAFCIMLAREAKSWLAGLLLALPFLLGINFAGAVESGFKNSFSPSFLCLFLAVIVARNPAGTGWRWFCAGALTALGILFRETFLLFPVIGCITLAAAGNWRGLWRFIAGGVACALSVTAVCAVLREQLWGLWEFYFVYGKIYGPEAARRWPKFVGNGLRALFAYWPMALMFLLAWWSLARIRGWRLCGRAWFWIACACAPLLEPMAKIGFLYHFSACLPGMAGLCASAYAAMDAETLLRRRAALWIMAICACCMLPSVAAQYEKLPVSRQTLAAYPDSGWPDSLADRSTTLEAVRMARQLLPEHGTASSSGFAYFVFPAGLAMPPSLGLGDLSRTWIYSGSDRERFLKKLDASPPDVVLLASTSMDHSATFERELKDIFDHHPGYEYAGSVSPDLDMDYGWLGYHIYRKKTGSPIRYEGSGSKPASGAPEK